MINRFLEYVKFDTSSDPYSGTSPSSKKQLKLAKKLADELIALGLSDVRCDEYGYVYGFLQTNTNSDKVIGLIAHMDTSCEASGANIKPQIVENYDGNDLVLNKDLHIIMQVKDFPHLKTKVGHTLIHTDGTTLLGADDKAGITIIMECLNEIIKNNLPHPSLIITFTPDEEIGEGTKHFNYEYYQGLNCTLAYTLDGGEIDEISFENFNAASCLVTINGKSIHPGDAKGKMINSSYLGVEFINMLPLHARPELTEKYEGFYHLVHFNGTVEKTTLEYIIRDHDQTLFQNAKTLITKIAEYLNAKYGEGTILVDIKDTYYNMKELVLSHHEILEYAIKGLKRQQIEPKFVPIRGGTDGATLSYHGIYTPNLGTGGGNFHGPFEYLDVTEMIKMKDALISILAVIIE